MSKSQVLVLHIHLCDHCLDQFHVIDKVGLTLYKFGHDATLFLFAIVICFLRHPLIRMTYTLFHLYMLWWTLGIIAVVYFFNVWHFFGYDIPEWMLLEQTHVYGHIFGFLLSNFIYCDIFSQTEPMLTFDLNIFAYMLSWIMKTYWF